MKNLLYLAAIAATAVGFTSCSSEEDLNNAAKDSGVPFKVTVSAPTRATDVASANFTNFQLYAFEGTNEWISGGKFTKSTSWAPISGTGPYIWPTAATTSNLYGVSENAASMSSAFVDDIANLKSFTYTVPTTIADQKDLLVASTTGKSTDPNVALTFSHALAAATLKLTIDPTITNYVSYAGYRLRVEIISIKIHNVNTKGTYSFTTNSWSNIGTLGTYEITPSSPIIIDTKNDASNSIDVDLGGGSIMFIPGAVNYWDISPNAANIKTTISTPSTTNAYIEFVTQAIGYDAGILVTDLTGACNKLKEDGVTKWVHKDANGNFLDSDGKEIATSEGEVKDISNAIFVQANQDIVFDEQFTVTYETYKTVPDPALNGYFGEHTTADYGILYKPLCNATSTVIGGNLNTTNTAFTLSNLKEHKFNVNIAGAVRAVDGDGTFGSPTHAGN